MKGSLPLFVKSFTLREKSVLWAVLSTDLCLINDFLLSNVRAMLHFLRVILLLKRPDSFPLKKPALKGLVFLKSYPCEADVPACCADVLACCGRCLNSVKEALNTTFFRSLPGDRDYGLLGLITAKQEVD